MLFLKNFQNTWEKKSYEIFKNKLHDNEDNLFVHLKASFSFVQKNNPCVIYIFIVLNMNTCIHILRHLE